MNATIENFINRYNPGVTSLLTRLTVAITKSERELARVTAERDARGVVLERVLRLLAAEVCAVCGVSVGLRRRIRINARLRRRIRINARSVCIPCHNLAFEQHNKAARAALGV